ncbi:hypothetical protein ABZ383_00170 [Streptomyces sp. NPDC005900]|uniref:hypothetical protein n=1 Tax=Streptomyces sp. NPDC005900 TaxID=3154569 RepID=UPI0033EFDE63
MADAEGADSCDVHVQDRLVDRGVVGLWRLAHALGDQGGDPHRITVLAAHVNEMSGGEPQLAPAHSALFGLAKVIGQEHTEIVCRCVDIADDVRPWAWVGENLCADPVGQVALRVEGRYVAELVEADPGLRRPGRRGRRAGPRGVNLIPGGPGLEVARPLSARQPALKIALVGRRAAPTVRTV